MSSPKKEITEAYAAVTYITMLGERIKGDWDEIRKDLKDLSKDKHIIRSERQAIGAFLIANIAIGMQAIKNIFSTEQAERLNAWMMYFLDDENRTEVMKYIDIYEKAVEDLEDPVSTVSGVLLVRWLGKDAKQLERLGLRLHFLVMYIDNLFLGCGKYWKIVKEKYKLTESDLPLPQQRQNT